MTEISENGYIQILTYIRRRPDLTLEQFYDHWENIHAPKVIPWAQKHGIVRYQQIHISGSMVPIASTDSAPNAQSTGTLPNTPIEYNGIAIFVVPSLVQFIRAFEDPYYVEVIEPDEREMIDKAGPGSGIVASFQGKTVDLVHQGQSMVGTETCMYRRAFEEFEKKKV